MRLRSVSARSSSRTSQSMRLSCADVIVQRDSHASAGALRGAMLPRMIDEDASHHLRRNAEEMRAVLPGDCSLPTRRTYASWTSAVGCNVWSRRSRADTPLLASAVRDTRQVGGLRPPGHLHVPTLEQLTHAAGHGCHSKSLILWEIRIPYTPGILRRSILSFSTSHWHDAV